MIARDVRRFLKRFETTLAVLARDARHVELEARFEDFHKLLGAWLDIAPPGAAAPERMRFLSIIDRFGGPFEIDIYEVARASALSGDSSTVVVLTDQLMRSAFACLRRDQPRLMEEFLNTLVRLYYQCLERTALADAMSHRLDSGLHSLFMAMRAVPSEFGDRRTEQPADTAALDAVLRFALALTHAAIRYEQTRHATFFVERMFEHRKHRRRPLRTTGPVVMCSELLFDYVAVVLAGWALHILQGQVLTNPESARAVLGAALAQVPAAPLMVAEWEVLRDEEWHDAAIDSRLGISHWDVRDWQRDFRPGVGEVRWGGDDWVRLGLRASLLRAHEHFCGDATQLFKGHPRRFVWDPAKERAALQGLAANEWLAIPEGERQSRVDSVMQLLEQRARGANAEYLRYVIETPLSEARVAQLREDAEKAFASKQSWQRALRQAGLGNEAARSCPLRTRWGIWVPREYLLDDNNWASGFGEHLGEAVASREAMAFIHSIETSAQRGNRLSALAALPEMLREARRKMSDAGFSPNVVILPQEDRFAGALFQKPLWQVEGRHEFGAASIGVWEQLHVLRFPYTNPETILLLDTRRLIGDCRHGAKKSVARVWVEEHPPNQEMESKREAARAALNSVDAPVPESNSIQVLACLEVPPSLGLLDIAAAMAFDIQDSDGGYAVVKGSSVYHRPSCPNIEGEDTTYVLHLTPGDGKEPCPKCLPEQWTVEGRSGRVAEQTNSGPSE